MVTLYVTSITENAGKTMLCAGLGKNWTDSGKKVGYLKLLTVGQAGVDKDAQFIHKLFDLKVPLDTICPVIDPQGNATTKIKQALSTVAQDKDVVIIEGLPLNISGSIIETLDAAKVLVVHDYSSQLSSALEEYKKIGARLLGVAMNKVPRNKVSQIKSQTVYETAQAGINLLGLIPEDRILMTLSIADLAEVLQGKILNSTDKATELIENFMMGSSTFDRGAAYYSRKNNKAVILWGERPGFRKAALANLLSGALQTSTKCIVISANGAPIPAVAQKAEAQQVPLISAPGTIPNLVASLEGAMSRLKFNQEKKLPRLSEILRGGFNLDLLSKELGLVS